MESILFLEIDETIVNDNGSITVTIDLGGDDDLPPAAGEFEWDRLSAADRQTLIDDASRRVGWIF